MKTALRILLIALILTPVGLAVTCCFIFKSGNQELAFSLSGLGFALSVAILCCFLAVKRREKIQRLMATGVRVSAGVVKFNIIRSAGTNEDDNAKVVCRSSEGRVFTAYFTPYGDRRFINAGDTLDVYVDSANEKKYHVDIDGYFKAKTESDAVVGA